MTAMGFDLSCTLLLAFPPILFFSSVSFNLFSTGLTLASRLVITSILVGDFLSPHLVM